MSSPPAKQTEGSYGLMNRPTNKPGGPQNTTAAPPMAVNPGPQYAAVGPPPMAVNPGPQYAAVGPPPMAVNPGPQYAAVGPPPMAVNPGPQYAAAGPPPMAVNPGPQYAAVGPPPMAVNPGPQYAAAGPPGMIMNPGAQIQQSQPGAKKETGTYGVASRSNYPAPATGNPQGPQVMMMPANYTYVQPRQQPVDSEYKDDMKTCAMGGGAILFIIVAICGLVVGVPVLLFVVICCWCPRR